MKFIWLHGWIKSMLPSDIYCKIQHAPNTANHGIIMCIFVFHAFYRIFFHSFFTYLIVYGTAHHLPQFQEDDEKQKKSKNCHNKLKFPCFSFVSTWRWMKKKKNCCYEVGGLCGVYKLSCISREYVGDMHTSVWLIKILHDSCHLSIQWTFERAHNFYLLSYILASHIYIVTIWCVRCAK